MQQLHSGRSTEYNIMMFIADHQRALTSGIELIVPLAQKFACDLATLYMVNSAGLLELIAHHGNLTAEFLAAIQFIPFGKGMAGIAAERKHAFASCNLQDDQNPEIRSRAKQTLMRGAIAIPIVVDGSVQGVIGLASQNPREFSALEIDFISRIGSLFFMDGRGLPQKDMRKIG